MNSEKKRTVTVVTDDAFLYAKIALELADICDCQRGGTGADLTLVDIDSGAAAEGLTMSRRGGADIALPFALGALRALVEGEAARGLALSESDRTARLFGRAVRLTEVEFSLLSALYRRGGEYVSREVLLGEVWPEGADGGVLNVYVHYLREKLESGGERIILSSRNLGYAINEKYLGRNN